MMRISLIGALFLSLTYLMSSCNEPAVVGGELLADDQVNLLFTDTVSLETRTVRGDTVRTFAPGVPLFSYLFGNYTDPVFGQMRASIYAELGLSEINPDFINDTVDAQFDSIVLVLFYDTLGFYGDWNQPMTMNVEELLEPMDATETYFSNRSFATGDLLGSKTFTPVTLNADTTLGTLRVPLDPALGERLLNLDPSAYASDTSFQNQFQGLSLQPDFAAIEGLISFGLRIQSGGVILYFREDGEETTYRYNISSSQLAKTVHIEQDLAGAPVEEYLDDFALGDSLLFLQGLTGPRIEVEFPHIREFDGLAINKAELVMYRGIAGLDKPQLFDDPAQLFVIRADGDGGLEPVEDAQLALQRGNLAILNGQLDVDEDVLINKYSINLTDVLQEMTEGKEINRIFIEPYIIDTYNRQLSSDFFPVMKSERADRTIFYGPGHSQYPMKLELTYTIVN